MYTRSVSKSVNFWKNECNNIVKNHIKEYENKNKLCKDIILGNIINNFPIVLYNVNLIKYIQMKIGIIWQCLMGSVQGIENLGCGHHSSLDLIIKRGGKKYIVELKNSFNTDNSSSRKHNFKKLHNFVAQNKGYTGIYATINCKTSKGIDKNISYNGCNIRILSGSKLLSFIFKSECDVVITEFKNAIENILQNINKI